jgi:penicillin-binding protein 2
MMAVFAACLLILTATLFNLTVLQGNAYANRSENNKTRQVSVTAKRGNILDSSGVPLAYDKTSYNVTFYRDPLRTGERWRSIYTDIILKTVAILEKNGNKVIDTFSIKRDSNGMYYFDWGNVTSAKALADREKLWRGNMAVPTAGAEEAFQILRQRYMIPDELDHVMARKVLSIWQEVQNYAFKSYVSVVIAFDVDASTVAEIEQRSLELEGMRAVQSFTRIYPNDESAAHIVGYMSKVYDPGRLEALRKIGYTAEDLVGMSGVEATMEQYLTSSSGDRKGYQVVEVDSRSKIVRVLEQSEPTAGNDVILTIDAELQKVVEQALAANVRTIAEKQLEMYNARLSYYQQKEADRGGLPTRFAKTGAAIVMDVNTGQILALASYPSYDPNLFTGGISVQNYADLSDEATTPLFNKAISSRAEPGSIFKMVTGYAGLMEGVITPETRIDCQGSYDEAVTQGNAPSCWIGRNIQRHANENITSAVKDSCNYFFFTVADRLGIARLNKWADIFGLTSKTGIELTGEVTSYVANQKVLYDNTKDINTGQVNSKPYLVQKALAKQLRGYGVLRGVLYTDEQINRAATRIVELVGTAEELGPSIRSIMREELDIPETITYAKRWHLEVSSILYEIRWNRIETVVTGIGQSVSSITPIAIVRYISAIANGGTVYEASIIKRVVAPNGTVIMENNPKVVSTLSDRDGFLRYITEGMREVISAEDGGTAARAFTGFEYVDDMAAKTGTAQVGKIDLENTAWFVAYTPYENAQIAIVVYIPNGYQGAMAAQATRAIIQFYRDRQKQQIEITVPKPGTLVE